MAAADYRLLTDATGQRMAAALEGMSMDRAAKTDLTSIIATGTTNTTGATITAGTYFYLNGTLVQAKTDIASGATFTNGTNYEAVTAGALNSINNQIGTINDKLSNFKCIAPTTDPWPGAVVIYTLNANNRAMYLFNGLAGNNNGVSAIFLIRNNGTVYCQNLATNTVTASYGNDILSISLPGEQYWQTSLLRIS